MIDVRVCRRCGLTLPLDAFPLYGYGAWRRKDCKACWAERERRRHRDLSELRRGWRWQAEERRIRRLPPAQQAWALHLRAQDAARAEVARAVRSGRLVRPKACQDCGREGTPIEGHHLDYARPLEVIFLCRPCHRACHRATPQPVPSGACAEA